jgi:glycosyltransferase involved in cell wall biosynthesis
MAHVGMVLRGDIRYDGRVRKEIGTLARAGHQVELIVSDINGANSGGEDLDAKIHYVPMTLWSSPARNFVEQIMFNRKAAAILEGLCPTYIHCHDLCSLLAGVWAKRKLRRKLIFDAHELMPESLWGYKEAIWNWIERQCIKHCDSIIMPEKNRIEYFKRKYLDIPEPLLLPNVPRRSEIPTERLDLFRRIYPIRNNQKIILYTGLLAEMRHIEDLIDSMTLCGDEFVLIAMGRAFKGYDDLLRTKIAKLGLTDRVFLHEPVPSADILRYMASCDIGTAFYRNTDVNNYYCASNKVFEYIALDKPLLTNDYPGLLEVVHRFGQGICLPEITPESLAEAYSRAGDPDIVTPGRRKFFWEDEEEVLTYLYDHRA